MKIKYPNKGGKRSIRICENCNCEFETLDIKIRAKGERFCSDICYRSYRKANKKDEKYLNILHQKKHKYGLSKEAYEGLYIKQDNRCGICGIKECDIIMKRKKLFVDHCHTTGEVRGLLCTLCNSLLGNAKDNSDILNNAIKYLEMSSNGKDTKLISSQQ